MIGWSSGFDLETVGGSMSRGRMRTAWETLAWTSWRARSTSRESSISTVMLHEPWRELEVIVRMPSTWISVSSSGSTTSFSMTSGAAPSQVAETLIVGKSTSGNWLMPIRLPATTPKTMVAAMSIQARTGFLTQASVRFMGRSLFLGRRGVGRFADGRGGGRRADPHRDAVREGLGAADDEHLAAAETGEDLDAPVGRPHAQGQDALDGLVVFDDVGQKAALARPDGADRDDRGLRRPRRPGP